GQATPAFGLDVRVSYDNDDQAHNEFFGASNPANPLNFLVGANGYNYNAPSFTGHYATTDGGQTWAGGNFPSPYPGGFFIFPSGDPAGDFDGAGVAGFTDL